MSQRPRQYDRWSVSRRGLALTRVATACSAVLVGAMLFIPAGCQRNGRRHHSVRNLALYNQRGQIDLSLRYREDQREPLVRPGNRERFQETIMEESLTLKADGFVYHPTLLEFSVGTVLGLRQAEFEQLAANGTETSSDDGEILEFEFSGRLLQRKPYPTTFYARRARRLEPRPFRTSVETVSTSFGVLWKLEHVTTPIELQFDATNVDLDPFIRAGEVEGRRENTTFRAHVAHYFSQHNQLHFRYRRETIKEEPFALDYDLSEARLTHELAFGADRQHRLVSELRQQEQSGTYDSEHRQWNESLFLHHTDKLDTSYRIEITERSQGSLSGSQSVDEESYGGVFTLDHQLYDNLNSHFTGYYQNQDFDSGLTIRRAGWHVDFRYYRHNPWGVLRANYRYGIDNQELSGGEQAFEVVEERRTFADPAPLFLNDPNIETGSIVLLREDRTERYRTGRDYRIRRIGDRIEIERVVTGRIQDGDTVLLSYRFHIGGSYELDTVSQTFGVRQEFDFGLTPYYRLRYQDQQLRPADATGVIPEDIRAHIIGVEYHRGTLRMKAEYEDHESTVSPFEATRLSLNYSRRFKSGATGAIGAQWSDIKYSGVGERKTRLWTIDAQYLHPITPMLSFESDVSYRREEDTLSGSDEGVEVDLALEWLIRKTEIRVEYEYATFRDDFAKQDSTAVYVQLRRKL